MKMKGLRIAKTVLKKHKSGRLTLADLKSCCKAADIKDCGTGVRTDRTGESLEIDPHIHGHLTFNKGTHTFQWWGEREGL